jgi:cytoskeletal protein CcmA (bactofilin family)
MFSRSQRPEPDAIEVVVGPRATFGGTMRSETSIRIDGAVEGGLIESAANVILTETARVTCEIVARTVSIRGTFQGIIRADRVELLSGSRVAGSINVNSFFMDEGVVMSAEVNLRGAARPPIVPAAARPEAPRTIPVVPPVSNPGPTTQG